MGSRKIKPSWRLVFPASVLGLYLVIAGLAPQQAITALSCSLGSFFGSCCRFASFSSS